MDIGQRIKFVRKLRKISQVELAGMIGLPADENGRIRISQYENGKRTPKKDMLEKISKALGVNSLYLSNKDTTYLYEVLSMLFDYDEEFPLNITKSDDHYLIDLSNNMFNDVFDEWIKKKDDLNNNKISKEDYIEWKINYTGENDQ